MNTFDVIVVGAGHAGCEAALASARMGARTALVTSSIDSIAQMSCNPAIGGTAKGHLVKEIDALGGAMARVIDHTGIQFRTLNVSKGPAIRSSRAQADRMAYSLHMRYILEHQPQLHLLQDTVEELTTSSHNTPACVQGVRGRVFGALEAPCVVLTTGTFLHGKVHIGRTSYAAGRGNEQAATALARFLKSSEFRMGRLKTGTPPRLDRKSIDFSSLEEQHSHSDFSPFSFAHDSIPFPHRAAMHLTATNIHTHRIVQTNIQQSALYNGQIQGTGPRYCPSIEDKVMKFPDRLSHQIFLEPTTLKGGEIYPNGISTSLPLAIQQQLIRSIPPLRHANITRPGYAIEYDYLDPTQLHPSLECKTLHGLFLAGQINGTTGYEEAAAQGLMAGINAARQHQQQDPIIIPRHKGYIGVLIDDLTSHGTQEPYRMFTSRAEHRLYLREDNADLRLTPLGRDIGLVNDSDYSRFLERKALMDKGTHLIHTLTLKHLPSLPSSLYTTKDHPGTTVHQLIKRPHSSLIKIAAHHPQLQLMPSAILRRIEIETRYAGYIHRQNPQAIRGEHLKSIIMPQDFNYHALGGLSTEVLEKLTQHRPQNLYQASRISGITPSAIQRLQLALQKRHAQKKLHTV